MLLHDVAQTALDLAQTNSKLEKSALLGSLFQVADDADLVVLARYFAGQPFALHDQRVLNVGGAVVRKAVQTISGIDTDTWNQLVVQQGDTGVAAGIALADHAATQPTLTLQAVQSGLEHLAVTRGTQHKTEQLEALLRRTTVAGSVFLIKLIGGELRIGVQEGLVEDAIARTFEQPLSAVRRANMLLGDVGATALLARQQALASARLQLFHPLKFMLASPIDEISDIRRSIAADMFVEDKYDGIRAQAHHTAERTVIYSRTLDQITQRFPELAAALEHLPDDVILDGEILAAAADTVLPFSALQKRLGRKTVSAELQAEVPVVFVVYDVLYHANEVLLEQPLHKRRAMLEALPLHEPLRRSLLHRATDIDAIDPFFDAARARGNEGLMVKDPQSIYRPGRRGREWLKVKRALATLDVVVTAAEVGHGKRRHVLSDYTFAVRRSADDPTLLNIGKAYSGLTDAEIEELTRWFKAHTQQRYGRVHIVEPQIVLEVAFDAVQVSPRHKSGYALRFPRIVRVRHDKPVAEIDTLAQVQALALE